MSARAQAQIKAGSQQILSPAPTGLLQRKCACGNHTMMGGECTACSKKKWGGLQTKLQVSEPGDAYEQEADRIADQVLTAPANPAVSRTPPCIQRFTGQAIGKTDTVPASVDDVLASPGRPLDPAVQQDMGQRFGYDFSGVRVHSGRAVEQSVREVKAHAYTVGHNIVFGAGSFAPGTHEGRRLIAHELTHVVQQAGSDANRFDQSDGKREQAPIFRSYPVPSAMLNSRISLFGNKLGACVQRSPADIKAPEANEAILGASKSTSEIIILYHYGDLEGLESFESHASYPRLTEYGLGTTQREVVDHTGTPIRETLQYRYELKIDRAYFEKNFVSITGTRGAYSEWGTKKKLKIPVKYFKKVYKITAAPLTPAARTQQGGFTAKEPGPEPGSGSPGAAPATSAKKSGGGGSGGGTLPPPPPGQEPAQGQTGAKSPSQETQAVVGEALAPVPEHGLSPGGTAAMNAAPIALQLFGDLLNYFGDRKQAELASEALQPKLAGIAQELADHPDEGVLLLYNFEQVEAGEASVVQPGARFLSVHVAYGRTRDEALSHVPASAELSQTGAGTRPVGDTVWHAPQQLNPADFARPFPEIALARFKPGHEKLQQIKWTYGKLSHSGSTSLPSPAKWGWAPFFYVLKTPESLAWVEPGGRRGTTAIALDTKATANGFSVAAAAGAVPVVAFDENTYNLFQAAKDLKTRDNNGELSHYTNIDLVRWASPDDIEIVKVLSHEGVGATIPVIEKSDVEKELAYAPAQVRALWEGLTHKGDAIGSGGVLERFLAVVPSDLTADEVERLTARQKKAESVDDFFDSLEKSIRKLPSRAGGQGAMASGGGIDFRKASAPGYAAPALTEQVRVLLGGVTWSQVQQGPTSFDNVIGKEGSTLKTFAYGIDDQGRHWGALVTVSVAKNDGGFTPVTVRSATVLVSEQGEALYGNSVLWGRTFRLKPEQGSVRP